LTAVQFEGDPTIMKISRLSFLAATALLALAATLTACSGKAEASEARSMETIQAEAGIPVRVRKLATESFSVYRKYPTTLMARSESTAYAMLSDVVREIKVKVGDRVVRDQAVIAFSSDNSAFLQAQASFKNAEAAFTRSSVLFAEAGVSKQDFDNVRTQYEVARAAYKSASDMVVAKAPIDGYVSRINVRLTENVRPGAALFTVTNQNGYEARLYATMDEIADIRVGARARLQEGGATFEGRVAEVSLVMDGEKKAFPVVVQFAGEGRGLVSGMGCDVAVEIYRNDAAIVVARSELVRSGEGWAAFIVNGGSAELREVAVGRERGLDFEIAAGLLAGDQFVSEVKSGLSSGDKVFVVDSSVAAR
jgi:RND family efflux transporter MFP subunit